jgi:hypothetical protein
MRAQAAAEEDRATSIAPAIQPSMPWRVRQVTALGGYRLAVQFVDGTAGAVDMSDLVASPNAGVFEQLRDPALFAQVHVEHGAVVWPGELDLAPDAMHAAIVENGEWKIPG